VKAMQLKLMPEQSATIAPGVTLRYDSAEDSRCPTGVQCIWAGTVLYHFTLSSGGAREALTLSSAKPSVTSGVKSDLHIALAAFEVPPARKESEAAPRHPVVLDVRGQ
jgi:hypothetical protein